MKTRQSHRAQTTKVSPPRWLAYATAGAATALAGSHSAEGAIHYSGILNVPFRPHKDHVKTFPLDQAGDFISFQRGEVGDPFFGPGDIAYFRIFGIAGASFQANPTSYRFFVYKLPRGQNVSAGSFFWPQPTREPSSGGVLASGDFSFYSHWGERGTGYIGFRFNSGAGLQYGWARISISGHPENAFIVVDYAYADPGEPIKAGQKSDNEMVLEESNELVPEEGSLGGLALGAVGLLAWRKSRSRAVR